jgi:DNA-binding transcriptional ArsR family regulator
VRPVAGRRLAAGTLLPEIHNDYCTITLVEGLETGSQTAQAITDSRVLAAMSHPARRRLIDALTVDGPSTASMLAARTGQAVGNASHHLKVLAQASLIEEAPALARDRRERWWRVSAASRRWSSTDFAEDPVSEAVAGAAESLNLEHQVGKVRAWHAQRDSADREWTDAAFSSDAWLRLTPAELRQLSGELGDLLRRWRDRPLPADAGQELEGGDRRRPVFVFARGVPAEP